MQTKQVKNQDEQPKELQVIEELSLQKPEQDTKFAHEAAKFLMDIVKKNNWAKRLGGSQDHLQYEAWQTVGKYYGYTVKTQDAEYIELGGTWGFKAKAVVVNEQTGIEVGSADAFCMSDENNWRSKPKFQLASMAQTRAGSKALRQILGFVVALAGYSPTPSEEMDITQPNFETHNQNQNTRLITEKQIGFIKNLAVQKGSSYEEVEEMIYSQSGKKVEEISQEQASLVIGVLMKKKDKVKLSNIKEEQEEINMDEASQAVDAAMLN